MDICRESFSLRVAFVILIDLEHFGLCYLETSFIPCVGIWIVIFDYVMCSSTNLHLIGRGARRTREPVRRNNETIGELDVQGNDRGVEANGGVGGVPVFFTIIAQQLQNLLPTLLAQVGNQGNNQGNNRNQNGDAVNDNIQGDVRNVIVNNDRRCCTYKEFLACNLKEYDGKGGAIVYTRWIEKMESVQDISGCGDNQKDLHTKPRGRCWDNMEDFKTLTREEFYQVNEMQKLQTEFWNHAMVRSIRRKSCAETMEQYMSKTRADYGSGVARPKIEDKDNFELKGQFLKELRTNTFSSSDHEDTNEHIEKVLEIVTNIPCDLKREDDLEQQMSYESDNDMEYDPSDARGDDEVELTDKESSDSDDEDGDEVAKIFRIETNVFDFETPLCRAFKEFNYLLQIDPAVLTKDINGFKTYEEYKDDWIYEWNKDVPWVNEKPWMENGVWKEPTLVKHHCKPFNYKTRCLKWPTYSWKDDEFCNGGNLLGAYIIGNTLRYQDLEWYEALKDGKLKEEAIKNKAIMDGMIDEDDESSNEGWKRWDDFDNTNRDNEESENEMEHEDEERSEVFDDHERPACYIRRFKMVKYSFRDDEEYVAIKENEYDDLTNISEEAIHTYQEIFCVMDEGWMVTCTE
ncbi:hypothetical protein Tco_0425685 [Tanacetum coccineum]